ncbi:MAG: hypothetical protein Q9163_005659 [Psora crenata]
MASASRIASSVPSPPNTTSESGNNTLPHTPISTTTTASPSAPLGTDMAEYTMQMSPRKRRRSSKPSESRASRLSSPPSFAKPTLSPIYTPRPLLLTGAAAIADQQRARAEGARTEARQTSPNPARKAIGDLLAASSIPMSKLDDAPSDPPTLSKPLAEVAPSLQISLASDRAEMMQNSPKSVSSPATWRRLAPTTTTNNNDDSNGLISGPGPGQMDDAVGDDDDLEDDNERGSRQNSRDGTGHEGAYGVEARSNKAFTYPGRMAGQPHHRTASLPRSGYGEESNASSSSTTKRHKCPYCSTDFTRHHNLKSHLLTHSQEKPYSCDMCDSRFRRLHDLKRHTKLHTGERPHVCLKCDRSFARGDALARHTKGQGGCAGRRESMGSLGGDDRYDERLMRAGDGETMPGIIYTAEASHEPEHMDEDSHETPSGRSLASIRRHDAPPPDPQRRLSGHHDPHQPRQPNTYPPVAARPPVTGGLYPPPPAASPRGGSGASTAHSSLNHYPPLPSASSAYQTSGPNVFAQGGMTESPKPLSPGGATTHAPQQGHGDPSIHHRNRSPSLTQQLQHQQYRRATGNKTSPPMNLPPPPPPPPPPSHPGSSISATPHLPPLQGLTPPDPRYTLATQAISTGQMHAGASSSLPGPPAHRPNSPSYPPGTVSSTNNSISSHNSTGPHDRSSNNYGQPTDRLWAYVESLASKVSRLEDEVSSLKEQTRAQSLHR